MPSQDSEDSHTRYQPIPARPQATRGQGQRPNNDAENLGIGASNKAVGITLTIGIGLMLLVLILPYLNGG